MVYRYFRLSYPTHTNIYETLLDFVLFKLYNDIGVRYPLHINDPSNMASGSKSAILGANLKSLRNALNSSSGAISAVLGSYMVLFPRSRIKIFFFFFTFTIPAIAFLGLWFLEQIISGVGAIINLPLASGGIAWWAPIRLCELWDSAGVLWLRSFDRGTGMSECPPGNTPPSPRRAGSVVFPF